MTRTAPPKSHRARTRLLVADLREIKARARNDELTFAAAAIAFYAFLALVPALVAGAAIYGLVADPKEISRQVSGLTGALPASTRRFLIEQVTASGGGNRAEVSLAAALGLILALWSASAGTTALLRALAVMHGAANVRSYARRRGLAVLVTLGVVVVVLTTAWLVSAVPPFLASIGAFPDALRIALEVLRWPVLALILAFAVRGLFQISAGYRADRLMTPGPIVASLLWLGASALFSLYTANFSNLARTYGSVTSIIVVLLWLYFGGLSVLVGAEVDAVIADRDSVTRDEHGTAANTAELR
jgi:membrane protein